MPKTITTNSYPKLLQAIKQEITSARGKIDTTRARAHWKAGEHIHKYKLGGNGKAIYGGDILVRSRPARTRPLPSDCL